jgi:hypothetical protein
VDEIARRRWHDLREHLDERAAGTKDSMQVVFELSRAYGALPDTERPAVNEVLSEWILSHDDSLRYDALYLAHEHLIRDTVPALRALRNRLQNAPSGPGAPFEWAKVVRILG